MSTFYVVRPGSIWTFPLEMLRKVLGDIIFNFGIVMVLPNATLLCILVIGGGRTELSRGSGMVSFLHCKILQWGIFVKRHSHGSRYDS